MIGLDTNVLVRYLTFDDSNQALIATNIIDSQKNEPASLFVSNIVLCELIWVLSKGYNYKKKQITSVIKILLSTIEFSFEQYELIWQVLLEYERSAANFSDILIGKLSLLYGCTYTITFDNKASFLKEFKNANDFNDNSNNL